MRDFPYNGSALFLGDDDLVSTTLAAAGLDVTVVDVDGRLACVLGRSSVRFVVADVRPDLDLGRFDAEATPR